MQKKLFRAKTSKEQTDNHLPSLEAVIGLFLHAGLETVCGVDGEELFVISGRKPSGARPR